jgi:ABC-type antimicrobial peptide transport system permease subunit
MEIVGISEDARYGVLKNEIPLVAHVANDQGYPEPDRRVYELRTAGDPLMYVNSVREIVHRAYSRVPISNSNVNTQGADIDQNINPEIIFARLCTGLAFVGLTIACVGLYGTPAYNVAGRTGEIGIRMALGRAVAPSPA